MKIDQSQRGTPLKNSKIQKNAKNQIQPP
uniref:Uncharacterized protein n=1 Tax=Bracon brevicornis TaxID=1563983 RepID=A0A6V7I221_9HYME